MLFIVRKLLFYPFKILRSRNTIARAERIRIKPISDYKMGDLSLALRKALCQAFSRESGKRVPPLNLNLKPKGRERPAFPPFD